MGRNITADKDVHPVFAVRIVGFIALAAFRLKTEEPRRPVRKETALRVQLHAAPRERSVPQPGRIVFIHHGRLGEIYFPVPVGFREKSTVNRAGIAEVLIIICLRRYDCRHLILLVMKEECSQRPIRYAFIRGRRNSGQRDRNDLHRVRKRLA